MPVLAAIAVILALVTIHELGHFLAARLQGIHVSRFSIGFGPALLKWKGAKTEYMLCALPLGGYVAFPDEDPDSNIPKDDPDLLGNRPILDRAIVISAGVIANLVFAYLVFVAQFTGVGVPEGFNADPGVMIPDVAISSPAADAGMQAGDLIVAIEDQPLGESQDAIELLMDTIQSHPDQAIDITVERSDRQFDLTVVPNVESDGVARIGVQLIPNGTFEYRRPNSILEVITLSASSFQDVFFRTLQGFGMLLTRFSEVAGQVAGPVGIVKQGADFAASDPTALFPFTAIISINLAIINILPLPALDGGQLAFLLVEGLRGKPLPTKVQENVMQTGLLLLLGLGIFLIFRDTSQLIQSSPTDVFPNSP